MKQILFPLLFLTAFVSSCARKETVNILSYNVHNCIGLDGERDYRRIADVIRQADPDVVAIQEVDSATTRNGGVYALGELAKHTQMHGIFGAAIPYQGGSYGIGILSKEKPIQHKVIPMPGREEERALIVAEFEKYVFCATHQSLTPEDQELSVPLIAEVLKDIRKPIFMAGDMNSFPTGTPQQMLAGHFITLSDTAAFTFPANEPDQCIDYIYAYSGNNHRFNVERRQVLNEPVASDHRPIQVIVRIEE